MQRVSRSAGADIRATIVRIFAYMGGLGLLAMAAASFFRTEIGVATITPSSRPEWIAIDRPHPAFELQMPEWAFLDTDYAILRRSADSGRKDVLTWGDPGRGAAPGPGPYIVVEIYRPGTAAERFIDAPSEIAARIVPFTVRDDVKPEGSLDTKFGLVSLVDFAMTVRSPGLEQGRPRRCLGFARPFESPLMQISGWYCSPGEEVVNRGVLACALDRLTVLSAGGDGDLAALFARAEVKRSFCGQRSPILAATPERASPIATPPNAKASRSVKLRGRLSLR